MKSATSVFWCSFFVNQRGCPRHLLTPLFNYLVENSTFINDLNADEKESYESGSIKSHDDLLDAFVESIYELCDEWVISDAGIAFIITFSKKQYIPCL
jgi:hypothetical protein